MKKVLKILSLLAVIFSSIFLCSSNIYALSEQDDAANTSTNVTNLTPSRDPQYNSYDYVIDAYDVNMIVNENNTIDITESITAYFHTPKHGIYRTIPLSNKITRLDGTTSTNRAQITNVSVNNEYTTSKENGNYKIKIGSNDKTLTGEQKYVIKYTYNLGQDSVSDYDELYYNIIGSEWDTVIGGITFTITMPKEFDSSKLGFSSGAVGSTENNKIKYSVNGNTITGSYAGILGVGEALTVRCELPEGYFVGAGLNVNIMDFAVLIISVILTIVSLWLWYRYGRDEQTVDTVEFYPPNGLNSLDTGFLYKGKAEGEDVTSLLIYLANKGYLKIIDNGEGKEFSIKKLKDYDGTNPHEQWFMEGLFEHNRTEVTDDMLNNHFYLTENKILKSINDKQNLEKIFEKSSLNKKLFIIIMLAITYCLITVPPIFNYYEQPMGILSFVLLFPAAGFLIIFKILTQKKSIAKKIPGIIWSLIIFVLFCGLPCWLVVLPALMQDTVFLIEYIAGIVCIVIMSVCLACVSKRTKYGNEMLGKLNGFRTFLETAEKEKLEAMVAQDPTYFYDILPYTYVLGVSDKWIKKFETISLQAPSWYDSPTAFDLLYFGTFMNNTMSLAQNVMSSDPSRDSGSSSSGGGFSGGGSGGGGGGSW